MRTICGVLIVTMTIVVQAGDPDRPRDPVIAMLALDARAQPPEFSADILLRLSDSPRVDASWRRELLEEAYLRAYSATETYRLTGVGVPPDTRQGAAVIASDTGLTRVSLQLRAAETMAFVDPARAREMFEWIDLDLVPGTCESLLVPAVDEYYATLAVLARTFGADAQGRGDALRFLSFHMWRAHLPTEMPALALALRSVKPAGDEATFLASTLRWILESSVRDPRGFSSVSVELVARMLELEDAYRTLGVMNWYVTRTLRDYLVAQLKGSRCSDSLSEGPAAETFNAAIKRRNVPPEAVAPLAQSETRPSRVLGIARLDPYWRTFESRRLYDAGLRLRGPDKKPVPDQKRMTAEWMTDADHLLTDVEQWSGSREANDRDYLYQKGVLYTLLIDLVPASPVRMRALRSFVDFLRHADRDRANRTLWFAFANRVIALTRTADRPLALDLLEESRHPVLSLYGRVERTLGVGVRRSTS